jgi:predicted RNA methylase
VLVDVGADVREDEGCLGKIKNRIVGSGEEQLDQIMFNPRNWRIHPLSQQDALKGVLEEVGWVQQVIVNKRTGNLIDGHLRCQLAAREGAKTIPIVYVDVSEDEEALVLATLDPIGAMAATDKQKLEELFQDINSDNENVQKMIAEIAEKERLITVEPWSKEVDYSDPEGDHIEDIVGYGLRSMWYGLEENNEPRKYMLELPTQPNKVNKDNTVSTWLSTKYSRTKAGSIERCIKTYMRPGDYFFEMCCGWMTFSSSAKYFGFSGKGGDIWDISLEFCKKQIEAMPGEGSVEVIYADCRNTKEPSNYYDFVHSNPPFFSLEPYGESDEDLASTGSYERWLDAMGDMGLEAERILKSGGLANFVINDYRKDGYLVPMHSHFIDSILKKSGLKLHDFVVSEVISQRLSFRKEDFKLRRTVKCHEYVITFKKP